MHNGAMTDSSVPSGSPQRAVPDDALTDAVLDDAVLDDAVPTNSVLADDARIAANVVKRAAELARRMRGEGLETEYKTSVSDVVTAADRAAEELVVAELARLRPHDGILGEEGSAKTGASGRTWVIDPVDGTYNFTTGSDYWCSAIALVEGSPENPDRLLLGAVHRASTGETWVGGPELPTSVSGPRGSVRLPLLPDAAAEDICAGTYLHTTRLADDGVTPAWLAASARFATWRMLGSASVDLAGVADGRLGAWFQHSVAPWDWLPGYALVAGVGGAGELAGGWRIAGPPSVVAELRGILG